MKTTLERLRLRPESGEVIPAEGLAAAVIEWTVAPVAGVSAFGARIAGDDGPLLRVWPLGVNATSEVEHQRRELLAIWPGGELREGAFSPEAVAAGPGLLLVGTAFQCRVWQALTQIPRGKPLTYGQLAATVASPLHSRAVGSAVARNTLAYYVPCHRVVPANQSRGIGEFRWGRALKKRWLTQKSHSSE